MQTSSRAKLVMVAAGLALGGILVIRLFSSGKDSPPPSAPASAGAAMVTPAQPTAQPVIDATPPRAAFPTLDTQEAPAPPTPTREDPFAASGTTSDSTYTLTSVLPGKAAVVNGKLIRLGQVGPNGVKLIEANQKSAKIEVNGWTIDLQLSRPESGAKSRVDLRTK